MSTGYRYERIECGSGFHWVIGRFVDDHGVEV